MTDEERLQSIVDHGALIGVRYSVIATIGYLELWPEHSSLFFNEIGDGRTGQQHIVEFDEMDLWSDEASFYKDGVLVALISPFSNWPNTDLEANMELWEEWQYNQSWRRPLDIENAKQHNGSRVRYERQDERNLQRTRDRN